MIKEFGENIFRWTLLILLQLFVLNNIQFSGFVNPYLYILFVMLLPFEIAGWLLLILGFVTGFVIDIASNTIGYHTISTVFMAYFRIYLLRFIAPHDGYEPGMSPTIASLGFTWFLKYSVILTFAHHLVLFWLESFSITDLLPATLRAIASSIFTLFLIVVYQILAIKPK